MWSLARVFGLLGLTVGAAGGELARPATGRQVDLTRAVVLVPEGLSGPEEKAVSLLVEEVEARSRVRWDVTRAWPEGEDIAVVAVGQAAALRVKGAKLAAWIDAEKPPVGAEGFAIRAEAEAKAVVVAGNDPRGVLFGVGRLLRELRMGAGRVELPGDFRVATAPRSPMRGHQLGYRPKTNSYDGWDLDQWERYIRDLVVFGANTIELLPPISDDDSDSPHFPRPPMEMLVGMSKLADDYGLDVGIWYPTAEDVDYADPKVLETAVREWGELFQRLPRLDALFVPGGDPGNSPPKVLMKLLEAQAESLRRHHPKAKVWVSPQGFSQAKLDEFCSLLRREPAWLEGVVHGPQVRVPLAELRAAVPARYPIRLYPDITHTFDCQFPVPDWDRALAMTLGREPINPRPLAQATIFRANRDLAVGFITYSEGCNDDVNKAVWSGLGWDPDTPVVEILRQYSRYFLGDTYTDRFAQALLALERNWEGPLLTNAGVETTLQQFRDLEGAASPKDLLNWRFQQGLYRAYYDAYVRDRLIHETALEARAKEVLRRADRLGSRAAMAEAEAILGLADTRPVSPDRRARVHELAEALFQSIRMQLSVARYRAAAVRRGANLDAIDTPLNDREWFQARFAEIRRLDREDRRRDRLEAIVSRTDPGPGGFYDDLGDPTRQPHLVRGHGFALDPDFLRSPRVAYGSRPGWPLAWCAYAQGLYDAPIRLRYEHLDPGARYRVRLVYPSDSFPTGVRIRFDADGLEVHPPMEKPEPARPVEFDVPAEATADGNLTLRWTQVPGQGGSGRGCQVAEVWLLKATK